MKIETSLFEDHKIRRIYDEESDVWWFSVIDIVQVLTQHTDYKAARNYWKVLKNTLPMLPQPKHYSVWCKAFLAPKPTKQFSFKARFSVCQC